MSRGIRLRLGLRKEIQMEQAAEEWTREVDQVCSRLPNHRFLMLMCRTKGKGEDAKGVASRAFSSHEEPPRGRCNLLEEKPSHIDVQAGSPPPPNDEFLRAGRDLQVAPAQKI